MQENEYDHIKDYVKNSVGDEETQLLISDFAILWNEYEDELYDKGHHIKSIPKMINTLKINGYYSNRIEKLHKKLLDYIKSRNEYDYDKLVNGFNILIKEPVFNSDGSIKHYDDGNIVYQGEIFEDKLKEIMNSNKICDKLYFMLLIVARVRNNMFHGLKGIYDLKYQKELFRTCNEILKIVLDIKRK